MPLEKKPFILYDDEREEGDSRSPISVKLNDKDEEMIKIGMYALNMHSRSGVLKELAEMGLNEVILKGLGAKKWHKLTRGDRTRLVHEEPKYEHFPEKGI